jgi:hypothetical protein
MKYSAIHNSFIITQGELELASDSLKWAMKKARIMAGVGLGRND